MGEKHSKVKIELEKQENLAGENLEGHVNLTLLQAVNGFSLTVKLVQKESVTFLTSGEADWHNNFHEVPISEQVVQKNAKLDIGLYRLPFSLTTHQNLPGSMKSLGNNHRATISYILVCQVQSSPNSSYKETVPVTIKQQHHLNKPIFNSSKTDLKYLNMINKGSTVIEVEHAKSSYELGEFVNMQVTVDNSNSDLALKNISVNIIHCLKFEFASTRWEERLKKVFEHEHPVLIPSSRGLHNFKTFSFAFQINLKKKHREGFGTSLGKIIESRYFFEVVGKFGNLANEAKTVVPVLLYPKVERNNEETI